MNINIVIEKKLSKLLESGGAEIKPKLSQLVNEAGMIVQNNIMAEAPVITHNLQANTLVENIGDLAKRVYVDEGNAPYALFVVKGTRPHVITAKNGGCLAFVPKGGGETVFARKVNHPGSKPNNYFKRGVDRSRPQIDAMKENILGNLVK